MILTVPGDKSLSQRALILAALADGESRLTGLLPSADPNSTAAALRALGADIGALPPDGAPVRVSGRGLHGLTAPVGPLDLGNSGTGARLLMGVLAGCPFEAVVTGDASLSGRPMTRVTEPLSRMGARFEALDAPGRLPIRVRGGELHPLDYAAPVASAQLKSALLLAGLVGGVSVRVSEPGRSRDHTERMLHHVGAVVHSRADGDRWLVELLDPPGRLPPLDFHVPGDFSSAAFLLVAGLLGIGGEAITIREVGLNPTRTGLLLLLERMGGRVAVEGGLDDGGEPVGSLSVGPGDVRGIEVGAADVLAAIDEIPALVALATRARGTTRITGAAELRVKETDRIRALVEGLTAIGVEAEETADGMILEGTDRPLRGTVESHLDHRIAMAFGLLGALPGNEIRIVGEDCVDVSFPDFWHTLARLKRGDERRIPERRGPRAPGRTAGGQVVTLDGPAGSGKSTTAREVARRLGFRHLDSGALYRALTHALLTEGTPPESWRALTASELARFDIRLEPAAGNRFDVLLDGKVLGDAELRGPDVTARVSALAGLPTVRAWLIDRQRDAALRGNLVTDGRDMGTVVFPGAEVKVFLVADLEERARRRLLDHGVREPTPEQVREEAERLRDRDRLDSDRTSAPLRQAEDAWVLDTTGLDFEEQVGLIVARVRARG